MTATAPTAHDNPQYLHGQLLAMRALIAALADLTTDRDSFRERGLQGLERLKSALLPAPVADAQIAAVERWLRQITE